MVEDERWNILLLVSSMLYSFTLGYARRRRASSSLAASARWHDPHPPFVVTDFSRHLFSPLFYLCTDGQRGKEITLGRTNMARNVWRTTKSISSCNHPKSLGCLSTLRLFLSFLFLCCHFCVALVGPLPSRLKIINAIIPPSPACPLPSSGRQNSPTLSSWWLSINKKYEKKNEIN